MFWNIIYLKIAFFKYINPIGEVLIYNIYQEEGGL